jgi:ATP-dependent Clp protease ATP-binding subunit ClpC
VNSLGDAWSVECKALLLRAKVEAHRLGNHFLGTEHLVLAMLRDRASVLSRALTAASVRHAEVEENLRKQITPAVEEEEPFLVSPRVCRIVLEAERATVEGGLPCIDETRLLSAVLCGGRGSAVRALENCGIEPLSLLQHLGPETRTD